MFGAKNHSQFSGGENEDFICFANRIHSRNVVSYDVALDFFPRTARFRVEGGADSLDAATGKNDAIEDPVLAFGNSSLTPRVS